MRIPGLKIDLFRDMIKFLFAKLFVPQRGRFLLQIIDDKEKRKEIAVGNSGHTKVELNSEL